MSNRLLSSLSDLDSTGGASNSGSCIDSNESLPRPKLPGVSDYGLAQGAYALPTSFLQYPYMPSFCWVPHLLSRTLNQEDK